MTSQSTQTTTINNKTVSIQTDSTTQLSNSTQTRRVSLVSQEVQTMTPDNVTSDETNKLTQNTSTEDLNSASRNNTPSLGESNNSSTEQIKNDINTQMSSRDKSNDTDTQPSSDDLRYNSSVGKDTEIKVKTNEPIHHDNSTPPNRNPDSKLTAHEETSSTKVVKSKKQRRRERKENANDNNNDEKTCNLHIEQKYMDYLRRAIKLPDLSENKDLLRCYAEAVLDNPQNIEFLDIAFMREKISFLFFARWTMKKDGSLSEQSKTNIELRIAYVMKLEKYIATNKPIKHTEITDLLYKHRQENNPSDPDVSKDQVVGNLRLEKTYFKYIKKAAVESILKDNVKLADCYNQAYEVYKSLILFTPENENYFASVCLVGSYDIAALATHCLCDNGKLTKQTKEIREIRIRYYMMIEERVRKQKPIDIYEMEDLYRQYVHEPLSAYK
ncbi:unnamed protein product [Rotaria socialis]|nr:unnamed protein product [Rotaria socialis]